ncbi:MAG: hypothetical protein RI897_4039 [Verrucomicrobiota bacterium]|jgi:voltage-gated potassium channel Kch
MLDQLLISAPLMSLCVIIHAIGVTLAIRWLRQPHRRLDGFINLCLLFITVAAGMVLCHLIEIGLWATLYKIQNAIPNLADAIYFSAVTYTTTGYGDLILPPGRRIIGAVEALTGILMCGWSTGFFFAVVSRIYTEKQNPTAPSEQ